jgi:protein-tyrosine phosphatase
MIINKSYLAWLTCFLIIFIHERLHALSAFSRENFAYGINLTTSLITFYPSFTYNWLMFGHSYSFDIIIPSGQALNGNNEPSITRDKDGTITAIDDGIDVPIMLSSIPYNQQHIEEIQKATPSSGFTLYSLNLDFERRWSNWNLLTKANQNINVKLYPTVDYTAPSMVDLVRLVIDLATRDKTVVVQCKAGRGRSATAVGAYVMVVAFMAGEQIGVDEIEKYLQKKRPKVHFNASHKLALKEFGDELIKHIDNPHGLLAALATNFEEMIRLREQEIAQIYAPTS